MTSRERVLAALSHRQPDKVAIDIGATCCSTMHVNCFERLRTYYGLPHKPVEVWDVSSMTGVMTDDLAQALRIDTAAARTLGTSFGLPRDSFKLWQTNMGQEVLVPSSFQPVSDGAGDGMSIRRETRHSPLPDICRRQAIILTISCVGSL